MSNGLVVLKYYGTFIGGKRMSITTQSVDPNDFDVSKHFSDSPFQNMEKEVVAQNIVLISKWNNNQWFDFTWEDYQQRCKHNVSYGEKEILDGFVQKGLLKCENRVYSVQDDFIKLLARFTK